jgi:hypothetical protein
MLSRENFVYFVFSCALVALGVLGYFEMSQDSHDECENVFVTGVYRQYHAQRRAFLQAHPLRKKVAKASSTPFNDVIQRIITERESATAPPEAQRGAHESFVSDLRFLARERLQVTPKPGEEASFQLLDDLVHWLFLQADLGTMMQEYLYHYIPFPESPVLPSELPKLSKEIRAWTTFSGLQRPPKQEDGFLHGNLPSKLFALPEPYSTAIIRLAMPLSEPRWGFLSWKGPEVHPEFLLFLRLQPSHLYVNLMKRKGIESSASKTLEKLEKEVPGLYVVTLDKNSAFYWQDPDIYPESMPVEEFKGIFLEALSADSGNFFWSNHLEKVAWRSELQKSLDGVYTTYFASKQELNRAERQDWIELTYLVIMDHLVSKWRPASMNITCKGSMDRAPSLSVLWMWEKGVGDVKEMATWLLGPPLLLHNRGSHRRRLERFVSAAARIDSRQKKMNMSH